MPGSSRKISVIPTASETAEASIAQADLFVFDSDHGLFLCFAPTTNPHDPNSYLKIDLLTALPGARLLSFIAVSNRTYTVQYRPGADTGSWLKLADVPARATNRVEVVTDPDVGPASRFYRLVTPVQP